MNKKVILSTGIGPLHLIKSAVFLTKSVDIRVIQSWIPKNVDSIGVKIFSKLVGHKHLAIGLKKRMPVELDGRNFSCASPDFLLWGLKICYKFFGIKSDKKIQGLAWEFFGFSSKKYIKNADIFHVRSGAGQGGAILKAKKEGMKVIVDHSIAHPAYMDKNLTSEFESNGVKFSLGMDSPLYRYTVLDAEMADVILVNSYFVKNTFISEGFREENIKVVYLGVREDFFGIKKNYELNDKIQLLFTGGFGFRKGAEYLLKALQELENEGFNFEMKVVGSFSEAKPLIQKYPLKSIEYIGFVPQDDLKKYLIESDIYVFPSLCEGCASSGMEALAAGLPTIATEESGFPIEHNHDGFIIPSKDVISLKNAILNLANDTILRKKLGQNAFKKISENYTWENYAENVNVIYNEMLS